MSNLSEIIIWDQPDNPELAEVSGKYLVFWQSYETYSFKESVSIPQLVEKESVALRSHYLSWIYKLGQIRVDGRKMVDCLEIRPGLSYWWMTLLAEKCNWAKSPLIEDAIRLFAFIRWIGKQRVHRIKLVSSKTELIQSFYLWCKKKKVEFVWEKKTRKKNGTAPMGIMCSILPQPIQAVAWLLRYLGQRIHLKSTGLLKWRESPGDILFVSYLLNLQPKETQEGKYTCNYWGSLPEFLLKKRYKTRWLHHYIPNSLFPNTKRASNGLTEFNRSTQCKQIHVALDAFLSFRIAIKTLRDWVRLVIYGLKFDKRLGRSFGYLAPLFIKDWRKSCFGIPAISNLLNLNIFEEAIRTLPYQRIGFYLQENQPWEMAFIHAWKKAGHGKLVGVPHSTVRFWDLRYFSDPRIYRESSQNNMPRPNLIAVNGPTMQKAYQKGKYPENEIIQVEALRYLHLQKRKARFSTKSGSNKKISLIVLGDYLKSETLKMLNILASALSLINKNIKIVFKPHPACPINPQEYSSIRMKVTHNPIAKLLEKYETALTGSTTTAAVEAYYAGLRVISVLNPDKLNLSPLKHNKKIYFVRNSKDLKKILKNKTIKINRNKIKIFNLNKHLPQWINLINN